MPSAGDNLSLGGLGKAVGVNGNIDDETALAGDGRDSAAETSLSDFYISAVAGMTVSDTTPNENSSQGSPATVTFSDAGSLFMSRIANQNANFTWSKLYDFGGLINLTIASDYTAPISYNNVSSNTSLSFKVIFVDFFNDHATNYGGLGITESVTIQNFFGG